MSSGSASNRIVKANKRRHDHYDPSQPRCDHCGNFIKLPPSDNDLIKTVCGNCQKPVLIYSR